MADDPKEAQGPDAFGCLVVWLYLMVMAFFLSPMIPHLIKWMLR